VFIVLSTVAE